MTLNARGFASDDWEVAEAAEYGSRLHQMAAINELAAPVAKQSLFFRFTDHSKG